MLRPLVIAIGCFLAAVPAAALAQVDSPEAQALRAQLAEIQQKLNDLARKEAVGKKFTEIGSSQARVRGEEAPRMVVRIYDLSDLYAIAPPYAAREPSDLQEAGRAIFPEVSATASSGSGLGAGGFGGGGFGGGTFSVPSTITKSTSKRQALHQVSGGSGASPNESFRTSVDSLIDTITTTIEPSEWDEVGGPSTIQALGASLVVSTTSDMHNQITALLDLFRKRWRSLRTVSIQAHWLWLTEEQLAGALGREADAAADEPRAYGAITEQAWRGLLEVARGGEQQRKNYHAVVTCYNGQTVHALSGSQRLVVTGMTPVVSGGETQAVAYQPEVKAVHEGAALQITPVVTRNAKYVVADVHSRVNLLDSAAPEMKRQAAAGEPSQVVAALDRPALQTQRVSTTLRIPVDTPTLIGGMTFATDDAANLYLFLTASVRELRDEEKSEELEKPADGAKPPPAE